MFDELQEASMQVWYQSSTPIGRDPIWAPYEQSLKRHVQKVARPDTRVDVHGVEFTHPLAERSNYVRYLKQAQIIDNAITAEREGYDVFCVGCTLDPGYYEIREVVDIPVVFLSETCFHLASLLADKFSLLAYNKRILLELTRKIRQYGLEERYIPCRAFSLGLPDLIDGFNHPQPIIDAVEQTGREAIENGAGILLSACNILNMVLVDCGLREIEGVPILDTAGAIVIASEFMVDLRRAGIYVGKAGLHTNLSKEELASVRKLYHAD